MFVKVKNHCFMDCLLTRYH